MRQQSYGEWYSEAVREWRETAVEYDPVHDWFIQRINNPHEATFQLTPAVGSSGMCYIPGATTPTPPGYKWEFVSFQPRRREVAEPEWWTMVRAATGMVE